MNRTLRRTFTSLFKAKVMQLAGPQLSPAERTAFMASTLPDFADRHILVVGGTRRGKSGLLELTARASVERSEEGLTAIDPHGSFVRGVRDWLANPANGQTGRVLHYLDPSSLYTFGLNPLDNDGSWEACHDASVTLASVIESRFEASPEETPRLARIVYVAAMICARHKLTLIELVELLSIGGEELRRVLLQDFDNRIVRRELEDLCTLASRSPREFLSVVESTKNRFVRWLSDRRLARILGQKRGLDPLAVMNAGDLVLADLSSLTYADAAFLGCLLDSMYFAAARHRPPLTGRRHRLILDEAESLVTLDVARMCDQSAKAGLLLTAAIQRLGQLRQRGDFVADALLTNCAVKICFGGLEIESARYMAENLFAGHLDLAEWKPGTERPVAVGNDKVLVRNRSASRHHAQQSAFADTDMHATGRMSATASASLAGWGLNVSHGQSSSLASLPDGVMPFDTPTPLGQNTGQSRARNLSTTGARSAIQSRAQHTTHARGTTRTEATAHATSISAGESEAFVTRYELLATATFSLEEQLHRAAAHLVNLPRRQCVIKIEDQAPYTTRTPDLTPAFKSPLVKADLLPRYMRLVVRTSQFTVRAEDIDAELAARTQQLLARDNKPEPDFAAPIPNAPENVPDPKRGDAEGYAERWWQRHPNADDVLQPSGGLRVIKGGRNVENSED
jgi:hypothetical protein